MINWRQKTPPEKRAGPARVSCVWRLLGPYSRIGLSAGKPGLADAQVEPCGLIIEPGR